MEQPQSPLPSEVRMSHKFQINLRGLIELLSDHLYSGPEVFVRELLQNAVDAIRARLKLEPQHVGEISLELAAPKGKPPSVILIDNGIGLTEEEVHRFLATIGESSKRVRAAPSPPITSASSASAFFPVSSSAMRS